MIKIWEKAHENLLGLKFIDFEPFYGCTTGPNTGGGVRSDRVFPHEESLCSKTGDVTSQKAPFMILEGGGSLKRVKHGGEFVVPLERHFFGWRTWTHPKSPPASSTLCPHRDLSPTLAPADLLTQIWKEFCFIFIFGTLFFEKSTLFELRKNVDIFWQFLITKFDLIAFHWFLCWSGIKLLKVPLSWTWKIGSLRARWSVRSLYIRWFYWTRFPGGEGWWVSSHIKRWTTHFWDRSHSVKDTGRMDIWTGRCDLYLSFLSLCRSDTRRLDWRPWPWTWIQCMPSCQHAGSPHSVQSWPSYCLPLFVKSAASNGILWCQTPKSFSRSKPGHFLGFESKESEFWIIPQLQFFLKITKKRIKNEKK